MQEPVQLSVIITRRNIAVANGRAVRIMNDITKDRDRAVTTSKRHLIRNQKIV